MPRPPGGFEAEKYALKHRFFYKFGLSVATETLNTAQIPLVRNYKSVSTDPNEIEVNPHNTGLTLATGSVCGKMSIIDRLRLTLRFNLTEQSVTDGAEPIRCIWFPIFGSFPEKWDAADDDTGATVASLLEVVKDATEEDITPLFNNSKFGTAGASSNTMPLSTANLAETIAILNMDTDATHEAVTYDHDEFMKGLKYFTNKGALRSCIGKMRSFTLSKTRPHAVFHIDKFVPRAIRRIMPYTYFAIMIHVPLLSDATQYYYDGAIGASKANVGVTALVTYDEWNVDHHQEVTGLAA